MSRYQVDWYCSRFLQTLVVIFPRKSTQVKIHTKMAIFWLVFSAKNPVKSDKLALIEGKILNLMFFHINTPVVPIEIWLPVTHDQRQKTLKVDSVLLFRDILKTKSCLECVALACQISGCDRAFYPTSEGKIVSTYCNISKTLGRD